MVIVPGLALAAYQVTAELAGWSRDNSPGEELGVPESERARLPLRELAQFGVVALYMLATGVVGFHAAAAALVLTTLIARARMAWWSATLYTVVLLVLLDRLAWVLNMRLPAGWVG